MIKKTKDYEIFKFRQDNRERIIQGRVLSIANSIKARNLLEFRPILVNEDMEIMDGQHRMLAAKMLDVEIYYEINKKMNPSDIILLNNAKSWGINDYLNFYCKNDYQEYIKLHYFMTANNLSLKVALTLTMGKQREITEAFRGGKYEFKGEIQPGALKVCWDTINYIKRMNGFSSYTHSARFWNALLKIALHRSFNPDKWLSNLEKMVERFKPKATSEDYMLLMLEVNNWHNTMKISRDELA